MARIFGFALSLFFACAALAQDLGKPVLLVAKPQLQGGYSHTAVLAVPTASGKHVGFILNRATNVTMHALFPEHGPSAKVVDPVYFGGPEALDAVFAVVRGKPGEHAFHLFADFYVTGEAASVDHIIEEKPNDARYYVGFVGWQQGELAMEIEKGIWYVAEPDSGLMTLKDSNEQVWRDLVTRLSAPRT